MTDHAAAVEAVRWRVAAAQKDLERFFAENPHLKTDEGWIADCATLLRAYEDVVERLANEEAAWKVCNDAFENVRAQHAALVAALERIKSIYKTRQIDKEVMEITHTTLRHLATLGGAEGA